MCGGDLNIIEGLSVAECEYCGSKQTIPTADNEKKMTLFTRASRLLRGCEFDKAAGVFENIVAEFPEEAEAYWGLVLCKYGIEYVDDPATGKKVPTCHRSSFESVLDDVNFELACENTDAVARRLYRSEARQIEELRRAIIEVSGKEDPYDLFISYKETDEQGERTLDSVIAQDIYDAFTQEAYRVFFSRISLEDKLGVEYEPYIFAALNSANVMLVVGTDYENFDSVWVKNEWSRFLKLMSQDKNKHLIPVYKNMDPYDMPKEFVKLAAQDMGKLGAMQDLVRGVKKLSGVKKVPAEEKRETVVIQQSGGANVTAIVKRGYMALEDKNWNDAAGYFDRVLDMDAECAEAYLGLFLIENNSVSPKAFVALILKQNEDCEVIVLEACPEDTERMQRILEENYVLPHYQQRESIEKLFPFDRTYKSSFEARNSQLIAVKAWLEQNKNLVRAFKFADGEALEILLNMQNGIISGLQSRVDKAKAEDEDNIARIKADYAEHLDMVEAEAKRQREAAEAQCEADYLAACEYADRVNTEHLLLDAAERLSVPKLRNYKDCAQRAAECRKKAEQIKAERIAAQEAERKRILAEKEAERQRVLAEKEAERQRKAAEKEERRRLAAEEAERKRALARERRIEAAAKAKKIVVALCIVGVLAAAGVFLIPKAIEIAPSVIEKMEQGKAEKEGKKADEAVDEIDIQEQEESELQDQQENIKIKLSPRTEQKPTIFAGSNFTLAVKADGTVVGTGYSDYNEHDLSGLSDIIAISAGEYHTVGLKSDGRVAIVSAHWSGMNTMDDWVQLLAVGNNWSNIASISSAQDHSMGVKSDGTVICAGTFQRAVSDWRDVVYISSNTKHTVGLKSDGTVVATGDNKYGQCEVSGWTDMVSVAAGANHTVGLKSDGTVVATGLNKQGQCDVSAWTDIVAISAGANHTVGLKSDGTVVSIGYNKNGQCDVDDWKNIVAISSTSNHTVGLKADGTMVATGYNEYGQCDVSDWSDIMLPEGIEVQAEAAESDSNISWELSDDGTLTISGMGAMEDYTLTTEAPWHERRSEVKSVVISDGITSIGSRAFQHCMNMSSITIPDSVTGIGEMAFRYCGRLNSITIPDSVASIGPWAFSSCDCLSSITIPDSVTSIGGSAFSGCHCLSSVEFDGTESQWNDIEIGVYNEPLLKANIEFAAIATNGNEDARQTMAQNAVTLSAGKNHVVSVKSDGTVVYEGYDGYSDVHDWTDIVSVSAGPLHTVGLKADGTVVSVGSDSFSKRDVKAWTNIVALSAGYNHTVGLKSDGTVVAVGSETKGQCDVSTWTDIVSICAGDSHTVGLKADGTVLAVGYNSLGQCNVGKWTDITAISAGSDYTIGLKANGTVVIAGRIHNDNLLAAKNWTGIVAISAGSRHIVGLKSDGTVVAAGLNKHGQCEVLGWSDIVAVSAGCDHTYGLKSDGTVVAVGFDVGESKPFCVSGWADIKLPEA